MIKPARFSGFPADTIQYLEELARNNNKAWFEANRNRYRESLLEPAATLVVTLGPALQQLSAGISYDTRANGQGSIMRIHRDTRFSKDKSPYNTSLRLLFWEGSGRKMENPSFFLRIAPEGVELYSGFYLFPKPFLESFREAVLDDKQGTELQDILENLGESAGCRVGGEMYKRVPQGYDPQNPRADLLRYKGLHAQATGLNAADIQQPAFCDMVLDRCRTILPLHSWLVRISG